MSDFEYDVVIVGSGFGGSVSALRASEKGYKVAVLESGQRMPDSKIPKTSWDLPHYLWFPGAEMYGIQRLEVLDDAFVMCGAGVGGGSHVYAQTLYVPPMRFFEAEEWSDITDWADELAPFIDQAQRMLGVTRVPYISNDADRILKLAAQGLTKDSAYNRAPAGVYFGSPGVEVDDPYFGGVGPRRTGCINCGNCMGGCGYNAKNKLNVNYLYLAEKLGADVHELSEVYDIVPLEGGGFEVHSRHPGWVQRGLHYGHKKFTAEQVIISAHAYGSSKLLTRLQHEGHLDQLSDQLGKRARTNSEMLLALTIPYEDWKADPERIHIMPGAVGITSAVWPDEFTSIEPCFYGVGSDLLSLMMTWHQHGHQDHPFEEWAKKFATDPRRILESFDARHWSERTVALLCMQTKDNYLDLFWHDGMLHSKQSDNPVQVHIPIIEKFSDQVAHLMGAQQDATAFEVINKAASAHFIGGITIAETPDKGAIDPYHRAFGYPGLHVIDGSVMPANPGVNPSLMITSLAERAMALWPNKGDEDQRPALGSSYKRVKPIMPHKPFVPAGAPGELRLTATKEQIIPAGPSDQN